MSASGGSGSSKVTRRTTSHANASHSSVRVCVSDRGKGRQRQAILGEHPSSFSDNDYGETHGPA